MNIDQELWRPVVGFEGSYEVSSVGRVRSVKTGRVRKLFRRASGHMAIYLTAGDTAACRMVHAMVLEAFVGPRPNVDYVARHLNGQPCDNRLTNLAWGTHLQNCHDARGHGTTPIGERNNKAKLSEKEVRAIRSSASKSGVLAEAFGVTPETIWAIRSRRTWQHV